VWTCRQASVFVGVRFTAVLIEVSRFADVFCTSATVSEGLKRPFTSETSLVLHLFAALPWYDDAGETVFDTRVKEFFSWKLVLQEVH
jgi:hypothetical protein